MLSLSPIIIPLVFMTSTFSGVFGMAGGMVLMAGLLSIYEPTQAIFIHGLIQFFANFQRYYQLREHVELRLLRRFAAGTLLAFALLSFVNFRPSAHLVYLLIGLGAFAAALNLRFPFSLQKNSVAYSSGFLVSALQIAGVVGPILDIISQDNQLSRFKNIGTKAAMVSVSHLSKMIFMAKLMGLETAVKMISPIELLAFVLSSYLGTLLGKCFLKKISDKDFYRATSLILFCISFYYIWRSRVLF